VYVNRALDGLERSIHGVTEPNWVMLMLMLMVMVTVMTRAMREEETHLKEGKEREEIEEKRRQWK
jgi:hypothetical protein